MSEHEETPVHFTDKRRIDPETGKVRPGSPAGGKKGGAAPDAGADAAADAGAVAGTAPDEALAAAQAQAAEHLADLKRVQAEYVNYRKRVDRDRSLASELTVVGMVEALLPVLDDIDAARQHGDLGGGPFAAIADKLEATLARFGWERYGRVGEEFDPTQHEALMHATSPDAGATTITEVLQAGHRVGDRIVRAARVAVVGPE